MRRRACLAGLMIAASAGSGLAAGPCTSDRVDLRQDGNEVSFQVELAADPETRARGLMGRESLAPDHGMLFVYDKPGRQQFWMKNTLIPLDMIFADSAGRVIRVHESAVPLDLGVIDSGGEAGFVLEINGGEAARLGIRKGSEMRHPAIGAAANWPCGQTRSPLPLHHRHGSGSTRGPAP